METENADYPKLEDVAAEVMSDIDSDISHLGSCDATGSPSASVIASVDPSVWTTAREARAFVRTQGWTPDPLRRSALLSPDGRYMALMEAPTEDDEVMYVAVRFYMAPTGHGSQ